MTDVLEYIEMSHMMNVGISKRTALSAAGKDWIPTGNGVVPEVEGFSDEFEARVYLALPVLPCCSFSCKYASLKVPKQGLVVKCFRLQSPDIPHLQSRFSISALAVA